MYLNCKTYFSFRYGTFPTKDLVQAAVERGVPALALTNINSTCDTWDFVKYCREAGIKPITGVEIRNGDTLLYILIAANNKGLAWIHQFLSAHLMEKKDFPPPGNDLLFFENSWDGFILYPYGAKELKDLLPNERIGLLPTEINRLVRQEWKQYEDKFVLRQPVTIQNHTYFGLHRLLRCIDKNILLSKLSPSSTCSPEETFLSPGELLDKCRRYPFLVTNTYRLMDACHIEMDFARDKNKRSFGGSMEDDKILLEKLSRDGFQARYGKKKPGRVGKA